jgi:hypothetical protein
MELHMMARLQKRVLCLAIVLVHLPSFANAADETPTSGNLKRVVWQFVALTKEKPTLHFRHRTGKEWLLEQPGGSPVAVDELSRTDEAVILQNRKTKLIYRLTEGRGFWRQPKDDEENWKKWVIGKWVTPVRPATRPSGPPPGESKTATSEAESREVQLVYFVPSDRKPVDNYRRRIGVIMEIVSEIFRDDLRRKRYQTEGFRLDHDDDGPIVHLVEADGPVRSFNDAPRYDTNEQWKQVVPVVREQLGLRDNQVVVVFAETYEDGPAEYAWPGNIALGAYYSADSGMAVFSAYLLQDEFCGLTLAEQRRRFFDATPVPGRRAWGQPMNSARGKFSENGIGAVAHELGHAFGLPHDRRRDDQFIMGNGFRNLRRNFSPSSPNRVGFSNENAALLMSSRYLNSELNVTDNEPPKVELKLVVEKPRSLFAEVTASDNTSLRSVVFSDGVAGTIVDGQKLNGSSKKLRHRINQAKLKDGSVEIRVIVTDEGGNQTRVEQTLRVQ